MARTLWTIPCLFLICCIAGADTLSEDKRPFHLFNPTPPKLMRELSADRPDVTESAYTVDAGHIQLEMSFVDFVYDDEDGTRTRTLTIAPMNLKLGLLNNADVQFVLDPYIRSDVDDGADDMVLDGFGDVQLRFKINLWGNDAGETAMAFMPFVKFPTASDDLSNDHVEGGLIFPLAMSLPSDFSLGLMAEVDFLYDDEDDEYVSEFLHTVALGHDLVGDLAGYVEYIGLAPLDEGRYRVLLGAGVTYALGENAQLDAGVVVGLMDEAEDFNVFTGLTFRR